MTRADLLAREIERVADAVFGIRALSRSNPHVFAEDKDALASRLRKAAADIRNTFGGPAGQFRPGDIIVTERGRSRRVLVETRRRAA